MSAARAEHAPAGLCGCERPCSRFLSNGNVSWYHTVNIQSLIHRPGTLTRPRHTIFVRRAAPFLPWKWLTWGGCEIFSALFKPLGEREQSVALNGSVVCRFPWHDQVMCTSPIWCRCTSAVNTLWLRCTPPGELCLGAHARASLISQVSTSFPSQRSSRCNLGGEHWLRVAGTS